MSRTVNAATVQLVKHFEGLHLEAYRCPAGVWTIGYGHTGLVHRDGTVKQGRKITEAEAERLLEHDLNTFAADVEKALLSRPRAEMTDNMFGALVSLAFNIGMGNLRRSTILQRINARNYVGAVGEFEKWNKAGGKVLRGLTRRRLSEAALFCTFPDFIKRP